MKVVLAHTHTHTQSAIASGAKQWRVNSHSERAAQQAKEHAALQTSAAAGAVVDDVIDDVSQVDYYNHTWRVTRPKPRARPSVDSELIALMLSENSGSNNNTHHSRFMRDATLKR